MKRLAERAVPDRRRTVGEPRARERDGDSELINTPQLLSSASVAYIPAVLGARGVRVSVYFGAFADFPAAR